VVGVYGVAEVMNIGYSLEEQGKPLKVKLRELLPTREEWRRAWAPYTRGTIVGFVIGLLPGPHTTLSSFVSYKLEKMVSKYRGEIGKGAVEGVAGPETANNAAATSTMVPLLAIGLPYGAVTALMLSAMMVHGVQPGPLLMTTHPEIFWGVIVSMYVGNVILLVMNVPMISVWVSLLRVPNHVFLPLILLMAVIGAYSVNNSMMDVYFLIGLGVVGYFLRKFNFQLAPMVIGMVLGPLIEKYIREGLFMNLGDPSIFWKSPMALFIWLVVLFVLTLDLQRAVLDRLFGIKTRTIAIGGGD
jgi:putative tricarboxylic transport membrane protein